MRLDAAVELFGAMPFFDLATAAQLADEPHASVVNQLHRWSRAGKLVPLRRGMYTFAEGGTVKERALEAVLAP